MFGKTGSHSRLSPLPSCSPTSYWRGSFLSVLHLCCQSICKHKEIWRICHPPTFLTQDVHHYACSLFLAVFLCLTVYSGKLALSERWWMTTPSFLQQYRIYLGDVCGSPTSIDAGFQTSAIPNDAAVNNHVHISFHTGADASREKFQVAALPFLPGKLLPPTPTTQGARHTKRHVQRAAGSVPAFCKAGSHGLRQ